MSWWSKTWHNVTDAIGDAAEAVGDAGEWVIDGIGDVATDVWHGIENTADDVGEIMVDTLPLALTVLGSIAGGPVGGALGALGGSVVNGSTGTTGTTGSAGSAGSNGLTLGQLSNQLLNSFLGVNSTGTSFNPTSSSNQLLTYLFNGLAGTTKNYFDKKDAIEMLENEQNFNANEAFKNRAFQMEMWNAANAYNSPKQQLQRLMAAGINPNALVGSSGYNSVPATVPSGSMAQSSSSLANGLLNRSSELALLERQREKLLTDSVVARETLEILKSKSASEIENIKAASLKILAEVKKALQESEGVDLDNKMKKLKYEFSKDSGIPEGVEPFEIIWKSLINGELPRIIDLFFEKTGEVGEHLYEKTPEDLRYGVERKLDGLPLSSPRSESSYNP